MKPDSPHWLYHRPQWLLGHLCSTWEPDCGSAPDQLCPRFQIWLLCRPNILSESGRQLQGHKAEKAMTTEQRKMRSSEANEGQCWKHTGGLSGWLTPHLQNGALVISNMFILNIQQSDWMGAAGKSREGFTETHFLVRGVFREIHRKQLCVSNKFWTVYQNQKNEKHPDMYLDSKCPLCWHEETLTKAT